MPLRRHPEDFSPKEPNYTLLSSTVIDCHADTSKVQDSSTDPNPKAIVLWAFGEPNTANDFKVDQLASKSG